MVHVRFILGALLFSRTLLVVPVLPSAAPEGRQDRLALRPEAEGRRQLWISKESEQLIWRLRIPERMFSDEVVLVGHDIREVRAPVQWKREGEAWVYHRTNRMDSGDPRPKFPIEYAVRVEPVSDGVALTMTVKNLGRSTLQNVVGHICFSHLSEPFRDPDHERTYIRSKGAFLNLKETGRGPDPIRARYGVEGHKPIRLFDVTNNRFWGRLSPQKADNGLILTRSRAGDQLVAIWFEPASEVLQNSDERNMCIHSDPSFGDLGPSESVAVEGRIILFRGDLTSFEERY